MAILASAPLRITLAGGGTDLPEYFERHGSDIVSCALDIRLQVLVQWSFDGSYILRYRDHEVCTTSEQISHPFIRAALSHLKITAGVEIVSTSPIPAGTGLGSSGAFGVALLAALHDLIGKDWTPSDLAYQTFRIERDVLGEPVGFQDSAIAALGGVQHLRAKPGVLTSADALENRPIKAGFAPPRFTCFYTGVQRPASEVLRQQIDKLGGVTSTVDEFLGQARSDVDHVVELWRAGEYSRIAETFSRHWERKRQQVGAMTSPDIDSMFRQLKLRGIQCKLVGAGGGGFLCTVSSAELPEPEELASWPGSFTAGIARSGVQTSRV